MPPTRSLTGDWLTPKQVAQTLDLPYGAILRYIREGRIAVYKFTDSPNGRIRIRPGDAEEFLERARHEARNGKEPHHG